MRIRAGARLSFAVYRGDAEAVSATFIAVDDYSNVITSTVNYDVDGAAAFQFDSSDTAVAGLYQYQITENFATGSPDIYPSLGSCDLPTLEICSSLSTGIV